MTGDEGSSHPTGSPAPRPEMEPRRRRRPLASPRKEFLHGPKHGGQALAPGLGLPAPASDVPGALPGPAADDPAADSGQSDACRTDGGEG